MVFQPPSPINLPTKNQQKISAPKNPIKNKTQKSLTLHLTDRPHSIFRQTKKFINFHLIFFPTKKEWISIFLFHFHLTTKIR
jgi:hypothetical protein